MSASKNPKQLESLIAKIANTNKIAGSGHAGLVDHIAILNFFASNPNDARAINYLAAAEAEQGNWTYMALPAEYTTAGNKSAIITTFNKGDIRMILDGASYYRVRFTGGNNFEYIDLLDEWHQYMVGEIGNGGISGDSVRVIPDLNPLVTADKPEPEAKKFADQMRNDFVHHNVHMQKNPAKKVPKDDTNVYYFWHEKSKWGWVNAEIKKGKVESNGQSFDYDPTYVRIASKAAFGGRKKRGPPPIKHDMLSVGEPALLDPAAQAIIGNDMYRIGVPGDGTCLVHSMCTVRTRGKMGDDFVLPSLAEMQAAAEKEEAPQYYKSNMGHYGLTERKEFARKTAANLVDLDKYDFQRTSAARMMTVRLSQKIPSRNDKTKFTIIHQLILDLLIGEGMVPFGTPAPHDVELTVAQIVDIASDSRFGTEPMEGVDPAVKAQYEAIKNQVPLLPGYQRMELMCAYYNFVKTTREHLTNVEAANYFEGTGLYPLFFNVESNVFTPIALDVKPGDKYVLIAWVGGNHYEPIGRRKKKAELVDGEAPYQFTFDQTDERIRRLTAHMGPSGTAIPAPTDPSIYESKNDPGYYSIATKPGKPNRGGKPSAAAASSSGKPSTSSGTGKPPAKLTKQSFKNITNGAELVRMIGQPTKEKLTLLTLAKLRLYADARGFPIPKSAKRKADKIEQIILHG